MDLHENIHFKETIELLTKQEFDGKFIHQHHNGEPNPSMIELRSMIEEIKGILFPGFWGHLAVNRHTLPYYLGVSVEGVFQQLWNQIYAGLCFECSDAQRNPEEKKNSAMQMASHFIRLLPDLKNILRTDVEAIYNGDPAAKNYGEIILAYPGLRAIANYRIAHALLEVGCPMLLARMITEIAHGETGIDIHPGACIGHHFAIDHGTGVVIGETSILGNNVKLYQGVTLGAKSFPVDEQGNPIKGIPRHPILKDGVIVYAGATVLGRVTIGENAVIGGNTWVTEDVAAGACIFKD